MKTVDHLINHSTVWWAELDLDQEKEYLAPGTGPWIISDKALEFTLVQLSTLKCDLPVPFQTFLGPSAEDPVIHCLPSG